MKVDHRPPGLTAAGKGGPAVAIPTAYRHLWRDERWLSEIRERWGLWRRRGSLPDIFLSYNREDLAIARMFADAFAAHGFELWWDATLKSGEAYDEVTENAL